MGGTMSRRVGAAIAAAAIAAAVAGCAAGNPPARPNGTTTPGATAPGAGTMAPGTTTPGGTTGTTAPGAGTTGAGTAAPGVGANLVPGRGITGAGMAGTTGTAGAAGPAGSPAGYGGGMNNHLVRTHPDIDHGAQISQYIASLGALAGTSHYNEATARSGLVHGMSAAAVGAGHFGGGGGLASAPTGVSTLVIGDMAFVGLHMNTVGVGAPGGASAAGDPRGNAGPGLEGYVRQRVLDEFPHLHQVFVTTNPAMVSRIARVTGDANSDVPARTLLGEMFDIARTLAGPVAAGAATGAPQSAPGSPRGPHGGTSR